MKTRGCADPAGRARRGPCLWVNVGNLLLHALDAAVVLLLLAAVFIAPFPAGEKAAEELGCLYSCLAPPPSSALQQRQQQHHHHQQPQQQHPFTEEEAAAKRGGSLCAPRRCTSSRVPAAAAAVAAVRLLQSSSGAAAAAAVHSHRIAGAIREAAGAVGVAAGGVASRAKAAASVFVEKALVQHLRMQPRGQPKLMPGGPILLPSLPPFLLPSPHSRLQGLLDLLPGLLLSVSFAPPGPRPRSSTRTNRAVNFVSEVPEGLSYLLLVRCLLLLIFAVAYLALRRSCAATAAAAAEAQEAMAAAAAAGRQESCGEGERRGLRRRSRAVRSSESSPSDDSSTSDCSSHSARNKSADNSSNSMCVLLGKQLWGAERRRQMGRIAAARAWRLSLFSCLFRFGFAAAALSVAPLVLEASASPSATATAAALAVVCCLHASALRCEYKRRTAAARQLNSSSNCSHRKRTPQSSQRCSSLFRMQQGDCKGSSICCRCVSTVSGPADALPGADASGNSDAVPQQSKKPSCSSSNGVVTAASAASSSSPSSYRLRAVACVFIGAVAAAAFEPSLVGALMPVLLALTGGLCAYEGQEKGAVCASHLHDGCNSSGGSISSKGVKYLRLLLLPLLVLLLAAALGFVVGAAIAAAGEIAAFGEPLILQQQHRHVFTVLVQRLRHAKGVLLLRLGRPLELVRRLLLQEQVSSTLGWRAADSSTGSTVLAGSGTRGSSNIAYSRHKAMQVLLWQQGGTEGGLKGAGPLSLQQLLALSPGGELASSFGILLLLPLLLFSLRLLAKCVEVLWLRGPFLRAATQECDALNASSKDRSGSKCTGRELCKSEGRLSETGLLLIEESHGKSHGKSHGDSSRGSTDASSTCTRGESSACTTHARSCSGTKCERECITPSLIPWFLCGDLAIPWLGSAVLLLLTRPHPADTEGERQQAGDLVPLLLPFCAVVAVCGAAAGAALLQQILLTVEPGSCASRITREYDSSPSSADTPAESSCLGPSAAGSHAAAMEAVSPALRDVLMLQEQRHLSTSSTPTIASSGSWHESAGPLMLMHAVSLRLPSRAAAAALQLRRASFACIEATLRKSPTLRRIRRLAARQKELAQRLLTPQAAAAAVLGVLLLLLFVSAAVTSLVRLAAVAYLSPGGHALHALERMLLHKAYLQAPGCDVSAEATHKVEALRAAAAPAGTWGAAAVQTLTVPSVFHQLYDATLYPDTGEAVPTAGAVIYSRWIAAAAAAPHSAAAIARASRAAAAPLGTLENLLQPLHPFLAVAQRHLSPKHHEALNAAACTREVLGTHSHYFQTPGSVQQQQQQQQPREAAPCSIYVAADVASLGASPFAAPPPSTCAVHWGSSEDFLQAFQSRNFTFLLTATPPDELSSALGVSKRSERSAKGHYCLLFAVAGLAEVRFDASPLLRLLGLPAAPWLFSPQGPRQAQQQQRWRQLRLRERDSQKATFLLSVSPSAFVYYKAGPKPPRRHFRGGAMPHHHSQP
ncbi:uncharacterized protein LOC34618847 [Cyclospora cayetanensis]|uniref:Uncharacterized protein LOC34618847 n=1 Tax=Cyclospora cayetanensis TaxID=88456 RepID=A0A6P6S156_9EIME|nr:uncharacterized protein LOC34618847 [Cyclospora cayetanensis]